MCNSAISHRTISLGRRIKARLPIRFVCQSPPLHCRLLFFRYTQSSFPPKTICAVACWCWLWQKTPAQNNFYCLAMITTWRTNSPWIAELRNYLSAWKRNKPAKNIALASAQWLFLQTYLTRRQQALLMHNNLWAWMISCNYIWIKRQIKLLQHRLDKLALRRNDVFRFLKLLLSIFLPHPQGIWEIF